MSAEDLENYETDAQMALYREYKDVMSLFSYAVETDRRFYLANQVDVTPHVQDGTLYFEVLMSDVWVWDGCIPLQPLCEEGARLLGARCERGGASAQPGIHRPRDAGFQRLVFR